MSHAHKSHEFGQKILSIVQKFPNPLEMLSEIACFLRDSFHSDQCILIIDKPQTVVIWPSPDSKMEEEALKKTLLNGNDLNSLAISSPDPFIIADQPVSGATILGMVASFQGEKKGLILLGSHTPRKWTQKEKNSLKFSHDAIAIAYNLLPSSHSPEAMPEIETTPSGFLNPSSPLIKQYIEATRQKLLQQQQLNEQKDHIIAAISDKVRNPLSNMRMAITMLKRSALPEDEKRRLSILEEEWQKLNTLMNNIITFKQLKANELTAQPQPLSLLTSLEKIIQQLQEKWQGNPQKQINFSLKADKVIPTFYTDPHHLEFILEELLTNAGNYADNHSLVEVTLENLNTDPPQVAFTIKNLGSSLSPEEQKQVFEVFQRGENALQKSIPGTGIGLAIVDGLVKLLQGKITFSNEPTSDTKDTSVTTVTLTLPSMIPPLIRK